MLSDKNLKQIKHRRKYILLSDYEHAKSILIHGGITQSQYEFYIEYYQAIVDKLQERGLVIKDGLDLKSLKTKIITSKQQYKEYLESEFL